MKPLLPKEIDLFLKRFDNFSSGEFRNTDIHSATKISVTLTAQDEAKEFDWITITLEFEGVSDAHLVAEEKLPYIDMDDGISLFYQEGYFYFGIGRCDNISAIKTSTLYIQSKTLKYKQGNF